MNKTNTYPIYVQIETMFNTTENLLSAGAAVPVVGTVAGVAKVALGISQTLGALGLAGIGLLPALTSRNWSLCKYSWLHVKHGMGNIAAGILESIPLVGTLIYHHRQAKNSLVSDAQIFIDTGHREKMMPYPSLIERDWKIRKGGAADDTVHNRVWEIYKDNKREYRWSHKDPLSRATKMILAQEAINAQKEESFAQARQAMQQQQEQQKISEERVRKIIEEARRDNHKGFETA